MQLTSARRQKFIDLANRRQPDWTVILENVSDWHNVGAVMRSCDTVGIGDIYMLYSNPELKPEKIGLGKRTTAGTRKWVQVHYFENPEACFETVRKQYGKIFTSNLSEEVESHSVYDLDFVQPGAYLFGNEHVGVSREAVTLADGNFVIPQQGMVGSLNISVACAVTLFEGMRQRLLAGKYPDSPELLPHATPFYERCIEMHETRGAQLPILYNE